MSDLENQLLFQLRAAGLPEPEREVMLIPGRKFRVDFFFMDARLAIEVEGGTWINGAHNRGKHFESDTYKYNELTLLGISLLRFTTNMISSGEALSVIEKALNKNVV